MVDPNVISLVSVVVTGVVAVAAHFVPLLNDRRKQEREAKAATIEAIQTASTEALAGVAHWEVEWGYADQHFCDFRAKLYVWQTLVDRQLGQESRVKVAELVEDASGVANDPVLAARVASQIVDLTEIALAAVEKR